MPRRRSKTLLTRRRFLGLGGTSLALAGLAGRAAWYEPQALRVETVRLPLAPAAAGLRLVQISDLHLSRFNSYFRKVAATVEQLQPDVILLTGDYLEEERNIRGVLEFLGQLKASHGVFAVQGNWEYWSRLEGENLKRHFAGANVDLLINARADLEVRGQPLSILGLDYPSSDDPLRRLQAAADPERLNILLSHVPAFAHEQLAPHIDLILSGHTHGGQMRLPGLPPLYLPRYSGRFIAGLYRVSQHQIPLYVNRGIGTSILPLRLLCRPEITLFELSGKPGA